MKKIIIVCVCIVAVGILLALLWPLPLAWFAQIKGLMGNGAFWVTMGIVVGILAACVVAYLWLIPILIYFFKKAYVYMSLACICLFRKYKFRMRRIPFASLGGLRDRADITVTTSEGTLHIHFLDFIVSHRRALTIPDAETYVITPTTVGKVSKLGGSAPGTKMNRSFRGSAVLRVTGHTLSDRDRSRPLPAPSGELTEHHILLVPSMPVEARVHQDGVLIPLSGGVRVGAMTYYSVDQLKKGLKGKLHGSLHEQCDS